MTVDELPSTKTTSITVDELAQYVREARNEWTAGRHPKSTLCFDEFLVDYVRQKTTPAPQPPSEPDYFDKALEAEGWIPWHGGERPVSKFAKVEAMLRDKSCPLVNVAHRLDWGHEQDHSDIIAYRIKPAWTLPSPPDGLSWHRADWQESMLPEGYRPLLREERPDYTVDEYAIDASDLFSTQAPALHKTKAYEFSGFWRTQRPLPAKKTSWASPADVVIGAAFDGGSAHLAGCSQELPALIVGKAPYGFRIAVSDKIVLILFSSLDGSECYSIDHCNSWLLCVKKT